MRYNLYHLIPMLLLVGLLFNACQGQTKIIPTAQEIKIYENGTVVLGPAPAKNPIHNPYNDTNLVGQYIRSMYEDSKGNFWIGPAGQSVARFAGDTLEYYSQAIFFQGNEEADELEGNSVHAITEDSQGNVWFGTEYGVVKYNGRNFSSYNKRHGLYSSEIGRGSILVDRSETLWVGTNNGVFQYDPVADGKGEKCFIPFTQLPLFSVRGIIEDDQGNIWFASSDRGVFRYDGETVTNIGVEEKLTNNVVGGMAMAQDKAGNMWFVLADGIARYDGENFKKFTKADGIGGSEVWGVYIEESGIIWITARGSTTRFDPGLPAFEPNAFTIFSLEDGINCCIQSMYQDRSGNMWWGSGQGLHRFNGTNFYKVKRDGPWE